MKANAAALALGLIFLPACTSSGVNIPPDTINNAKKALTAAHQLHRATADFLVIAATTNLCHASCASTAKGYLDQSETALVAADQLAAAGDAAGIEAKVASATAAIGTIQKLMGH